MKTYIKTTSNSKEYFRKFCLEKLKKAGKNKALKQNYLVRVRLNEVLQKLKFKNILVYMPLQNEVNLTKDFRKYRQKAEVLVPFMEAISFKVVKYRLPLFKKKFSLKEPRDSLRKFSKIDVMVVPVVGVDRELRRIGFGKGMYDRFFCTLKKKPLVIFVQLKCCCTKFVVTEDFDIQADIYISPQKTIKRGIYDNRNYHSSRDSSHRRSSRLYCSKKDK